MGQHAYLIMAHNDFDTLKYLLRALDDKRNDIYLHVDKKTGHVDFDQISSWVKNAGLFFVPRHKIFWGDFSIVECELSLLQIATSKKHYDYYHLLSGVDIPLKSQDYIHDYFEGKNHEFVTYYQEGDEGRKILWKIQYYYLFMPWFARVDEELKGSGIRKRAFRWLYYRNQFFMEFQKKHGWDRIKKYSDTEFVKGDQWFSITDDFAKYILANKHLIRKMFRFTDGPDEFFIPTLAYNSKFKERIAKESIRKIDWNRGTPYEFVYDDLEELRAAPQLFARKISFTNQPRLVEDLFNYKNF